jgi:formylglycine-generating enzyme required for sulfatase activity
MCIVVANSAAVAQSNLPVEVQVDLLRNRILEDVKTSQLTDALKAIDEYKALGVVLPPPLLLAEARAASKNGDPFRAKAALDDFLGQADRSSKSYQEGLALYPSINRAAEDAAVTNPMRATQYANATAQQRLKPLGPAFEGLLANMVQIPAGSFSMGDLAGVGKPNEKPVHQVTMKAFRLSKYDVTFTQYDAYAKATNRPLPEAWRCGRGECPVGDVSWTDAHGFIEWLNQKTSLKFRLPTEAEWEYAARAGTQTLYWWGNQDDASRRIGAEADLAVVGSKPPNAWGLFDMIGNVQQWTEDCGNDTFDGAPTDGSAWLSGKCGLRIIRGNIWDSSALDLRVTARTAGTVEWKHVWTGFRVAESY